MTITHLLAPMDILKKILIDYEQDSEALFRQVGIDGKMIYKPGARISHSKVKNFWIKITDLLQDPCFGLRGVKYWHPSHFNALGYAWLSSKTLREALMRLARYHHVVGEDRETKIEDTDIGYKITLSDSLEVPAQMDLSMAILVSACRVNYGENLNPVAVNFIHSRPDCAHEYYSFFQAPVSFDEKSDSIVLPTAAVDKPLATGNPYISQISEQYIISYLDGLNQKNIVARVKGLIIDLLPSGGITHVKVAQQLGMSNRSLQRSLQDARTNFRTLLEEVRKELCDQYVSDSDFSLTEIAFALGYSDYSSFSRAFKRWTKKPPKELHKLKKIVY